MQSSILHELTPVELALIFFWPWFERLEPDTGSGRALHGNASRMNRAALAFWLLTLRREDRKVSVSQATSVLHTEHRVTRQRYLEWMHERGFVAIERSPLDRRIKLVTATDTLEMEVLREIQLFRRSLAQ